MARAKVLADQGQLVDFLSSTAPAKVAVPAQLRKVSPERAASTLNWALESNCESIASTYTGLIYYGQVQNAHWSIFAGTFRTPDGQSHAGFVGELRSPLYTGSSDGVLRIATESWTAADAMLNSFVNLYSE